MAKNKKPKKHYPTDIPLAENVRLLKCGAWGYILHGKPIFKSANVETVNLFSKWVTGMVTKEGERMQLLEGNISILPKLFDSPAWNGDGHNYESQMKIPKG